MTDTYEFTGETREYRGHTLRQIRSTADILYDNGYQRFAGQEGGWIEGPRNLCGEAWVSASAYVYEAATVGEHAHVSGRARVSGAAWVGDRAGVADSAHVTGGGAVVGDARIGGYARILGHVGDTATVRVRGLVGATARVLADTAVTDDARIYGGQHRGGFIRGRSEVYCSQDVLRLGPIGSEDVTITLTRSRANLGYELSVGCWSGALGELPAEIDRRGGWWPAGVSGERWRDEYAAVVPLLERRIRHWDEARRHRASLPPATSAFDPHPPASTRPDWIWARHRRRVEVMRSEIVGVSRAGAPASSSQGAQNCGDFRPAPSSHEP